MALFQMQFTWLAVAMVVLIMCGSLNISMSNKQQHGLWVRTSFINWKMMYYTVKSVSVLGRCASICLEHQNCTSFCFDVRNTVCYVIDSMTLQPTASSQPADQGDCYEIIPEICPLDQGYKVLGGRCMKLFNNNVTYSQAVSRCDEDEAHLYHYKSLSQDGPPLMYLLNQNVTSPHCWLGADDLQKEGYFVWSDGTPLQNTSDLWSDNQPNNGFFNENCVALWDGGKLNDYFCNHFLLFVCQFDLD